MRDCQCYDVELLFRGDAFKNIENYETLVDCDNAATQGLFTCHWFCTTGKFSKEIKQKQTDKKSVFTKNNDCRKNILKL